MRWLSLAGNAAIFFWSSSKSPSATHQVSCIGVSQFPIDLARALRRTLGKVDHAENGLFEAARHYTVVEHTLENGRTIARPKFLEVGRRVFVTKHSANDNFN